MKLAEIAAKLCCTALVVSLFAMPNRLVGIEVEKIDSSTVDLKWFLFTSNADYQSFSLGEVRPGQRVKANLLFVNQSQNTVSLSSAKVSCACITAKVPKVSVASGDSELFEFEFLVDAKIAKEFAGFSVEIVTQGGVIHRLGFKGKIVDATCFVAKESYIAIPQSGSVRFELPIFVSPDVNVASLRVAVTKEFGESEFHSSIIRRGDLVVAKCEFADTFGILSGFVSGQVQILDIDGRLRDQIRLNLSRRAKLEVLPTKLSFIPDADSTNLYRSRAIVKILADSGKGTPTVSCKLPDGNDARVEVKTIGSGVRLVLIWLDRKHCESKFGANATLTWSTGLIDVNEVITAIDFGN